MTILNFKDCPFSKTAIPPEIKLLKWKVLPRVFNSTCVAGWLPWTSRTGIAKKIQIKALYIFISNKNYCVSSQKMTSSIFTRLNYRFKRENKTSKTIGLLSTLRSSFYRICSIFQWKQKKINQEGWFKKKVQFREDTEISLNCYNSKIFVILRNGFQYIVLLVVLYHWCSL